MKRINKHVFFGFIMFTLASSGCTLRFLPPYDVFDGHSRVRPAGKQVVGNDALACASELDDSRFADLISESPYSWLTIAASWCPNAMEDWQQLAAVKKEIEQKGIQTIVVFSEYRIPYLCRRSRAIAWNGPLFVLSHARYGGRVEEKTRDFLRTSGLDKEADGRYPRHYLLDHKGNVIYRHIGRLSDILDTIRWLDGEGELRSRIR